MSLWNVKKRDGKMASFDSGKIHDAINKAFEATGLRDKEDEVSDLTRKVVKNLVNKYECETITVEQIQDEVEDVLIDNDYKEVTKAYIIYRKQHENVRNMNSTLMDYKKLVDRYVERDDWRVKENSTSGYCVGGFILSNSGAVTANYWLNEVYDKEIADAHKNCDIHIHDLSMLSPYCSGNNLKQLILKGICGVPGHASSAPAKHLSTLCNQMVNFTGIMQNEWAGAQAFSSFDTYLAPFVKADNLSYADTKQAIQSYIYGSNVSSRWGSQAPFSNITLDWTIPDDLAELNCIVGGKEMDFKYKDCKKEMDMVNKAFLEVMIEGDSEGRGWEYPIPTYSITKDFDWSETENNKLLFEMAAKYGSPYFSNYINSDMKPSDVRSMAILGTQDVIYRTPDGRISKNEIRHLVHQWQKEPKKSYQFLMNGKFVDVTEMFEIPYSDYKDYVEIDLANGFKQPFSYDHKCIVLRDGTIQTVLSQDVKSGDKFLLAKNPYKENPENGDYNAGLMVGYYLAEGWVSHNGSEVDFAINIKRKDIVDSIKDFFNKLGCRVLVVEQNDVNIFKVKVFGKQAVGLVKNFVSGDYATEKRLETNVLDMSFDFRKGMYDGYLDTDGSPKNGVFAHTTNKKLCEDLIVLSATLGITLKYSEDKNNTRYFKEDKSDLVRFTSYKLDVANFESYEDYWAVPVKEVKLMDASRITKVYNFTVDTKEHLYTLPNGIITHQCCRLRLDLRELRRQNGGNFGAGENTGSIGVVTINLPRIG
jgi:ribonucleoside-triphosphate reductase